jgi:hypothetical protein
MTIPLVHQWLQEPSAKSTFAVHEGFFDEAKGRGTPPKKVRFEVNSIISECPLLFEDAVVAYDAFKNFSNAGSEKHSVGQGLTSLCAAGATSAFIISMVTI